MKEIPLPLLPDGTRLHPARLSVTLNLRPPSRATMLLPPEERVDVRQTVELFTPQGSAGLFRVTGVEDVPGEGREVTLRHTSATLADALIPGSGELTGSPRQVLNTLLGYQSEWKLGDVELPDSRTISCSYSHSNLLAALLDLLDELPECGLFFEAGRMHLRLLDDADGCECRLSRNLRSLKVSLDDSRLCTRVYMNGLAQPVDAPSIAVWGPVSRHLTASRGLNAEALTVLARQYLDRHSEPTLTVKLDAIDLHRATGEAFDRFPPGRVCRVCLPERGETIRQRVTAVTYEDVYGDPERAAVTLAEHDPDAADYVGGLMANVRVLYRDLADADGVIRLQAERIELLAEDILLRATKQDMVDLEGQMTTLYNEVSIELDAAKAELRLKASQQAVNDLSNTLSEAMITLSGAEAAITAQAHQLDEQGNELSSAKLRLDGLAGSIEVLGEKTDRLTGDVNQAKLDISGAEAAITAQARRLDDQGDELSSAMLRLDGLEGSISLKADKTVTDDLGSRVSSAEIRIDAAVETVDGLQSQITLKADRIDLQGYVTADQLSVRFAEIEDAWATSINTAGISVDNIIGGYADFDDIVCGSLLVGSAYVEWQTASVMTALPSLSTETLHITYKDANGINQVADVVTAVRFNRGTLETIDFLGK